jgi:hypothetical protein
MLRKSPFDEFPASLRSALLRRKPSSNLEQQLLQDRLFEIIEAD